jgi:RNA polymerase sigma-70 factor (family 1)
MPANTIQEHITQWLAGDDIAYRQIFDHYYPKFLSACFRSIRHREDCEEIVLNVFLNIWQRRAQLTQVGNFEKYLFRSLSNQVTDFHRKKVLQTEDIQTLPLAKLGSTGQPELSFKELERLYQDALNRLPEKQRIVFLMSREEGLSQKQIAEQNSISVNTVNNHIKSAMKSLRKDLGEYSEALPVIILLGSSALIP